ncbi:MAG: ABC transporter ATP-binding protein [Acidobacteriota bacterium]
MNDLVIETHELSKVYGPKLALHDLSLSLPRGGVHAVVGSNGAGKSTLFRILLGLTRPSHGSSRVLGIDSRALDPSARGRIGLVTEEHTLPAWMRVAPLVAMQRAQYDRWDEGVYRQVIGHFDVRSQQKVSQLSRGERAGLHLAMALAQRPELLILDEPTLGLDVIAKQVFLESLLFVVEESTCTIVYCSHQMDEIERVADQLILLDRGRLANLSSLDAFSERVSGWLVELDSGVPLLDLPGLLHSRKIEELHEVVVLDRDDRFDARLQALGARSVQEIPIGFDRAVNAFLNRHHHTPAELARAAH